MSVAHELTGGTDERADIDAVMRVEAAVLERHQHGEIARVNVLGIDRKPPPALGRGKGAQQAPVVVQHDGGDSARILEVGWALINGGGVEGAGADANGENDRAEENGDRAPPPPP